MLCLLCYATAVPAQRATTKAKLERQRQQTLRELEAVNANYRKVKEDKKVNVGQLSLIQQKISLRNEVINNIGEQLHTIEEDLQETDKNIQRLQTDLDTLKAAYAKSIVNAYKNRNSYQWLSFIFTSTSFNDGLRRVAYLRNYQSYQEEQLNTILQTEALLKGKVDQLGHHKRERNAVLKDESEERAQLQVEKKEKDEVVVQLKQQEQQLSEAIAAKKKRLAQLEEDITAAIRREIEAAKREALAREKAERAERVRRLRLKEVADRKALALAAKDKHKRGYRPVGEGKVVELEPKVAPRRSGSVLVLNDADYKLAKDFEDNKGRLPWPVDNGFLLEHYENNHIEGTDIETPHIGVGIGTSRNALVKAVFGGTVVAVYDVEGSGGVTIKHGDYFTTYGNLGGVTVKKNDRVRTGAVLGKAARDDNAAGKVEFIVMKEYKQLNPEGWLRKRKR